MVYVHNTYLAGFGGLRCHLSPLEGSAAWPLDFHFFPVLPFFSRSLAVQRFTFLDDGDGGVRSISFLPTHAFFFLAMAEPFLNLLLSLCSSFSPSRLGSGVNSKWGPATKQASGGIFLHLTLGRKKSVKPQKPQKKSVSVFFLPLF